MAEEYIILKEDHGQSKLTHTALQKVSLKSKWPMFNLILICQKDVTNLLPPIQNKSYPQGYVTDKIRQNKDENHNCKLIESYLNYDVNKCQNCICKELSR